MRHIVKRYIDALIDRTEDGGLPWNIEALRHGKPVNWNYIDGCMMIALMRLHAMTGETRYLDTVRRHVDRFVREDGTIKTYDISKKNLDDICQSRILFGLSDITGDMKYRKAIDYTFGHVRSQPRTHEGNFWHKAIYPDQVWLDGLFMAQPFYAMYASRYGDETMTDDIIGQFKTVRKRMFDEKRRLYVHGYDASKSVFWADPVTGRSANTWLRAVGWFALALVDTHEALAGQKGRDVLCALMEELLVGMVGHRDPETGLFFQVVDKPDHPVNYVETSGNALVSAAILKAVRTGMIGKEWKETGVAIFDAVVDHALVEDNGAIDLKDICLVAGLGPSGNPRRDGSVDYYLSEPVVKNDAKGVAPLLIAYVECLADEA